MPPVSSRTVTRSMPCSTISALRDDAPLSAGKSFAGRRLAKSPSSLRMPSRAASGRTGASSHLGPPTAPSSTASAACAARTVSSGRGCPAASIAAPPIRASEKMNSCPKRSATRLSTRRAEETISGPMPSPGRRSMSAFMFHRLHQPAASQDGLHMLVHGREGIGSARGQIFQNVIFDG